MLIYLHHEENVFTRLFCSRIFSNDTAINYLLDKYVVWPWDVTSETNKHRYLRIDRTP